ncbi:MAG: YgfZ/GcvT domain-containing protein [Deinococcus sp.]
MTRFTRLPSSALRLSGPDRLDFAQGQLTGHVKELPVPGMTPACFLNVRGQIEHFARVYRREHDLYLHLGAGEAGPLAARLRRYIIFDQVDVEDVSELLGSLHLWDEELPGWNPAGPDAQSFELGGGSVLVARVGRTGKPGLDLHFLRAHEAGLLSALGVQELSFAELEGARLRAGLPDAAQDGWAGFLPQEVGLGGAVHPRKGCYVGQEIMARLEARGSVRYGLRSLRSQGTGDIPAHTDVTLDGRPVGRTGASLGSLALARLRLDLPAGTPLQVGGTWVLTPAARQPGDAQPTP